MTLAVAHDVGHGPTVVLLHGFPELPSCWRAQIGPLAAAGLRVVVPYLRGYGPSPSPRDPADYTADALAGDVVGLLDSLGVEQALLVGHDWGAQVTWWTAQLHPQRVAALAALSVPFTGRASAPPIARLRELFAGSFFYMDYFQDPGVAEAELSADLERLLLGLYASSSGEPGPGAFARLPRDGTRLADQLSIPETLPGWLPAADLAEAVASFTEHGLTGPLNYYRAMDPTWHALPQLGELAVRCPALFLAGERDPVLAFTPTRHMTEAVGGLREPAIIPGAGHWVQREAADTVTALLTDYLTEFAGGLAP